MGSGALTTARRSRRAGPTRPRALLAAIVAAAGLATTVTARGSAQTHPGGRWLTLETAHFRVHVRPAQESLGVRVAGEAEGAYAALATRLPAPRATIDLVVTDHADYANGFATVFPSPRVVLYPFPPVADLELQRYDRWLRLLLTHELTHVFHQDLARGWWRLGRLVFGRAPALFPNAFLPTWLVEGLAVHYESRLTGAGRDAGSFHPAVVAAQAAEGAGVPIDAANAASPRWPGGYRPYAFGGAFLSRLAAERGDTVVDRLVLATARAPLPYVLLDRSARRAAGVSLTMAWRRWQAMERREVAADGRAGAAPCRRAELCGLRQMVVPRVSSDGRRVLFVKDDGRDAAHLAVLERGSGAVRTLARVNGGLGLAWDTGGAVLASEFEFTDPYTIRAELFRVDAAGRERRLTRGARLLSPDAAPDGSIVAVRADGGANALVRWSNGAATALIAPQPGTEWAHPRVSPGGGLIAATRARGGWLDVVLLAPDGAAQRSLTHDAALDQMPAFSPDGQWLFWASDRGGRPQVYATRLAQSDSSWWRVTDEPFAAYAPAPASDSVFYLAYHHDGYRLAAVPFDTLQWTRVVPGADEPVAGRDTSRAAPSGGDPGAAPGPASDSAAPRAEILTRHGYRPWPSLWPKYWLPVGEAQGSGVWAGIFTSGQDALDRHTYSAAVRIGAGTAAGSWRADLGYAYAGLTRAVLDAAYSRIEEVYTPRATGGVQPAGGDTAAGQEACCLRSEDASLGVTWRQRRFRWSAAARLGAEYARSGGSRVERGGVVVSAAAARLVVPAFAVSAQEGWRLSATLRRRWRLDGTGGYTEAVVRGSVYVPGNVVGFARDVVALRVAAGSIGGTGAPFFAVGGFSGGTVPLLPGIAIGSSVRSFPVRGYAPGDAVGRRALAVSVEARGPLALVGRGVGLVPGSLDRLSLTLFADGAVAWTPAPAVFAPAPGATASAVPPSSALVSVGAELVADLGVLYDYPVRLRLGAAQRLTAGTGAGLFAAVGAAF